jgi:hypothetical protein
VIVQPRRKTTDIAIDIANTSSGDGHATFDRAELLAIDPVKHIDLPFSLEALDGELLE